MIIQREVIIKLVALIKRWHDMGMPHKNDDSFFAIYYNQSPEMEGIRQALGGNYRDILPELSKHIST